MVSQSTTPITYQISGFDDEYREIFDGKLWRSFTEQEHAEQFLQGKVRFMSLQFYRKLEGERGDSNDGSITNTRTGILRVNGEVFGKVSCATATMQNVHEHFISCYQTLKPKQKDGAFVVEIENGRKFAEKFHQAKSSSGEVLGKEFITYQKVIYYEENDPNMPMTDDNRFYKTRRFEDENEYRFMLALNKFPIANKDSPLVLDVGNLNDCAKLLE